MDGRDDTLLPSYTYEEIRAFVVLNLTKRPALSELPFEDYIKTNGDGKSEFQDLPIAKDFFKHLGHSAVHKIYRRPQYSIRRGSLLPTCETRHRRQILYTAMYPRIIEPRISGYAATAKPHFRTPRTADHTTLNKKLKRTNTMSQK